MSKQNRDALAGPAGPRGAVGPESGGAGLTAAVALPFGVACAALREGLVRSVEWEPSLAQLAAAVARKYPGSRLGSEEGSEPERVLRAYARGAPVAPGEVLTVAFAWERLTPFARIVLRELAKVPYGARLTYGELAARCGNAGAARAVGSVLSRNPWPVLVPCHRVLGAGGKLAGFGKGTEAKLALLTFERANLERGGDA